MDIKYPADHTRVQHIIISEPDTMTPQPRADAKPHIPEVSDRDGEKDHPCIKEILVEHCAFLAEAHAMQQQQYEQARRTHHTHKVKRHKEAHRHQRTIQQYTTVYRTHDRRIPHQKSAQTGIGGGDGAGYEICAHAGHR